MQTGTGGISGVIDTSKIEAMVAQLKAAAARASGQVEAPDAASQTSATSAPTTDFSAILKNTLDGVNATQQQAGKLSNAYTLGDDSVNLSDVMIATQKANIAFQTTLQVRNKLVTAYTDIMNMQV